MQWSAALTRGSLSLRADSLATRGQKPSEQVTDRSNALFYGIDPDEIKKGVEARIATMDDPSMLICRPVSYHPIDSAELMKEILVAAYEGGGRRFSDYNYGMTPVRNFRWIGDAMARVRALDARA